MSEKMVLWVKNVRSEYERGMLIYAKEIETVVPIFNWKIRHWDEVNYDEEMADKLNNQIPEDFNKLDWDEQDEVLDEIVGKDGITITENYVDYNKCLCYDFYNREFADLAYYDTMKIYRYHDGSNRQTISLDDEDEEFEMTLKDKYNLDVWDGNNRTWGGRFEHAILHKVDVVDDNRNNLILWEEWSQWQGSHPTGKIMTHEEVLGRLEEENHPEIEDIQKWIFG